MSTVKAKNKNKEKGNQIMNMSTRFQDCVEDVELERFDNENNFHMC